MADNLPDPTPAPDSGTATPPQVPDAKPADQTPAAQSTISFDSFTDDEKKYLAGQGVTKQEELTTDSLRKVINHSQASQKTAQERQAELDRIKLSINPTQQPQANPLTGQPASSQPTDVNPEPSKGIDEVTAFTLSNNLATNFPELKEDLISGKFYTDMQTIGIPVTNNGSVNLNGILAFAKREQENRQLTAKLEELGKPNADAIPDANPTTPTAPADDAPMTKQIAQAILFQDPNHARAEESRKFLQSNV